MTYEMEIEEIAQNKNRHNYINFETQLSGLESLRLGEALSKNTTLNTLVLINQKNVSEPILKGLCSNKSITKLKWTEANLALKDLKGIAEVLKKNSTLTYLDLSHNRLLHAEYDPTDKKTEMLAYHERKLIEIGLRSNKTLSSLLLNDCGLGEEGGKAILAALGENKSLVRLQVMDNKIEPETLGAINSKIEENLERAKNLQAQVLAGNLEEVKKIVKDGVSLTYKDEKHKTALDLARDLVRESDDKDKARAIENFLMAQIPYKYNKNLNHTVFENINQNPENEEAVSTLLHQKIAQQEATIAEQEIRISQQDEAISNVSAQVLYLIQLTNMMAEEISQIKKENSLLSEQIAENSLKQIEKEIKELLANPRDFINKQVEIINSRIEGIDKQLQQLGDSVLEAVGNLIKKKEILEEQRVILKDQECAIFYNILQRNLNSHFIGQFALKSGNVKRELGIISNVLQFLSNCFGWLCQVCTMVADECLNRKKDKDDILISSKQSETEEYAEEVARRLAQKYKEQLKQCTEKGLKKLAEVASKMIVQGLRYLELDNPNKTVPEQMITAVTACSVNGKPIKVGDAFIEKQTGTNLCDKCTAFDIFHNSGNKRQVDKRENKRNGGYRFFTEQANTPTNQTQSQQMMTL